MATSAIDQLPQADGAEAVPAAAKGKRTALLMGVGGLIAGIAVGLFVVGPIFAKKKAVAPAPKPAAEAQAGGVSHEVANLVLNPAGTGGARFLMVTATFDLKDGASEQKMKDHDAEVRDRILSVLGRKTVDELSDISQREKIKKEVLEGVSTLLPKGSILKVFFAQFVIQ